MKAITVATLCALAAVGTAQVNPPTYNRDGTINKIAGIGITQNLNVDVPLNLMFKDADGKDVRLSQYFGRRPVLLNLIFYKCRGVCSVETEALVESFAKMKRPGIAHDLVGQDFDVLTVSIDPNEGPQDAALRRSQTFSILDYPSAKEGWHFLTGNLDSINKLVTSVGFQYVYNPATKGINHPAGIVLLSPTGKVSQYFYGSTYPEKPLHDGLALAGKNMVGPKAEVILLGCLCRDATTGKYTVNIERTLQVLGVLTVILLFGSVVLMSVRSKSNTLKELDTH